MLLRVLGIRAGSVRAAGGVGTWLRLIRTRPCLIGVVLTGVGIPVPGIPRSVRVGGVRARPWVVRAGRVGVCPLRTVRRVGTGRIWVCPLRTVRLGVAGIRACGIRARSGVRVRVPRLVRVRVGVLRVPGLRALPVLGGVLVRSRVLLVRAYGV